VERLSKNDRACAIAAATAQDLNDELTVIFTGLNSSLMSLEPGHPARPLLLETWTAAQRCTRMASTLLHFSARRGVRPNHTPMQTLVEIDALM
jgi:hypothetical protein